MKKLIHILALVSSLIVLIPSCVKTSTRGNNFECDFKLNTPVFYDGENVSFTVKTNRDAIKVVAFEFRESPSFVTKDVTYSTSDGIWTPSHPVHVSETRRGKLSISLQDPVTGKVVDFSDTYTAYAMTKASLVIGNDPIEKLGELPAVVGNDPFIFTVQSSTEKLILKDYVCEFNDGQLQKGREYTFGSDGYLRFKMEHPDVLADAIEKPATLSLTFTNPETEKDTLMSAKYIKVKRFKVNASISPSSFQTGDKVRIRLNGNREKFQIENVIIPWAKDLPFGLSNGQTVELNAENYKDFEEESIQIDNYGSDRIVMQFKDTQYSQRDTIVYMDYTAKQVPNPSTVLLDTYSVVMNTTEYYSVNVWTTEENTTNLFVAEIVDSDAQAAVKLYAPTTGETTTPENARYVNKKVDITDGRLFIKTEYKSGSFDIKVYPKGKASAAKVLNVKIRKDIAVRIKGNIIFFGSPDGDRGWYGFPKTVYAELVTFKGNENDNTITTGNGEGYSKSSFYPLGSEYTSGFGISFIVSVASQAKDQLYFYKALKKYDEEYPGEPWWILRVLNGVQANNNPVTNTYCTIPESENELTKKIKENNVRSGRLTCNKLCSYLQDMDSQVKIWYQHDAGPGHTNIYDNSKEFGTFSLELDKVEYDHSEYRLKYVIYLLEESSENGGNDPWWINNEGHNDTNKKGLTCKTMEIVSEYIEK